MTEANRMEVCDPTPSDGMARSERAKRNADNDLAEHPRGRFTAASWEEITAYVMRQCVRYFGRSERAELSVQDATQNVLVIMFRLDFGRNFDPSQNEFWGYVSGLVRHECLHMMAKHYRRRARLDGWRPRQDISCIEPVMDAEASEFREALAALAENLEPREQETLKRIIDRSQGGHNLTSCKCSTPYVHEHRLRRRLAQWLSRFRPKG
jgi:DNA-directed RNA polymerase specialized sigma24 family protein